MMGGGLWGVCFVLFGDGVFGTDCISTASPILSLFT